jgi:hypothetical protein
MTEKHCANLLYSTTIPKETNMSTIDTIKETIAANPFTAGVVSGVAATLTTVGVIKLGNKFLVSRAQKKAATAMAEAENAQVTEPNAS